jgi:hypothetical protein
MLLLLLLLLVVAQHRDRDCVNDACIIMHRSVG